MVLENLPGGGPGAHPSAPPSPHRAHALEPGGLSVVMGLQYGDEGKGKFVDYLAESAHVVCRAQGGNNAGHTMWIQGKKVVTHLIPAGLLRPGCHGVIGPGVVVDVSALLEEMDTLRQQGYPLPPECLHIDPRAHLILPAHRLADAQRESKRLEMGETPIGTTGRGIGPAYGSRSARDGLRLGDLFNPSYLDHWAKAHPTLSEGLDMALVEKIWVPQLQPYVRDTADFLWKKIKEGATVLVEGAQGALLDPSYGSYPFVTSSHLGPAACATGLGVPSQAVKKVWGVIKAYGTRVGNGPMVGEILGPKAEELRQKGGEYGATTGRPRRVGWLDLVALKYHVQLNGVDTLALMKSDVLCGYDSIGLVVGYRNKHTGALLEAWPTSTQGMEEAEAVVEFVDGWTQLFDDKGGVGAELKAFVLRIEEQAGVPVGYLSTGPGRDEGVWL